MTAKRVGEYELGERIGTGNFSSVRCATDLSGRQWAIKILDKSRIRREKLEEQILREMAIMHGLRHRNIIEMRDLLQSQNHYFLVLELVTGGELFDRIAKAGRLDEDTARRYFQQLIAGVHYCHSLGFAHRDLKPENLLLDANDTLKISDFGLGNKQQDALMDTVCGSPNYVAPEVLRGNGYNGFAADVWSCGVVLYVMLAGCLPFEDKNMEALIQKCELCDYEPIEGISEDAKDLLSRVIVGDPQSRCTLQDIIEHPWFVLGWDPSMLEGA